MPERNVAIVGATGYTGSELVRILHHHPDITLSAITSESRAGEAFSEVHPSFKGMNDQKLIRADDLDTDRLDLLFLALPHGVSMEFVEKFSNTDVRMIDLSGDFRLNSPDTYQEWYGKAHSYPQGFDHAVYGLPELFREEIKQAKLVANPGCYPTCSILAMAPLMHQQLITEHDIVIVDAKSGVTGAGVKAKPTTHFSSVNENFKAYGIKTHRHSIEIQQTLETVAGSSLNIQFTPHLLPVDRGILATCYTRPASKVQTEMLRDIFRDFYQEHPFVRITDNSPSLKDVRASNYCNLYVDHDARTGNIIVISVIDNLVKGAAGQAIQNMNLMLDLPETSGITPLPLNP